MVVVSVIVPIYNCEEYIEESIASVLNQTFRDIEVICIDDGSSDNSLAVLKRIASEDSRLKVSSQENQGSSVARNNALKKVTGDYIYFFDADDYIVEDCLEKLYNNAKANDSDIVMFKFDEYMDGSFYRHNGLPIEKQFPDVDFNDFTFDCYDYRKCAFRGPFAPWLKFYKRSFIDEHDCFEFPVGLNHNDLPFHVKTILKASRISFVTEYLYHYRLDNPNSISNTRQRKYEDIFSILQIVEDFLNDEELYEEFKEEFEFLKINRLASEMDGRPNEYFILAKEELSKSNLDNPLLSENIKFKSNAIINSNSIEEYNYKVEMRDLNNKKEKLSKKNKELKGSIEELKTENKKLKEQKKRMENKNKEILSSNSWKLTKPLRKLGNLFK